MVTVSHGPEVVCDRCPHEPPWSGTLWTASTLWGMALADPEFRKSLDEGLADVKAGRLVPFKSGGK